MSDEPSDDRPNAPLGERDAFPTGLSESDRRIWDGFARLNERERRYLKLSAQGFTSKDIALLENSRDQRISKVIERARAKCGGILRRDLSRKFAEWENWRSSKHGAGGTAPMPKILDDQSLPVAGRVFPLPEEAPVHRDDASKHAGHESADTYGSASPSISVRPPIGLFGGARNELDRLPRLVAIFFIALAGVLTAGAAASLLNVLDRLASSH